MSRSTPRVRGSLGQSSCTIAFREESALSQSLLEATPHSAQTKGTHHAADVHRCTPKVRHNPPPCHATALDYAQELTPCPWQGWG
eukprot:7286821-Prymnesium_polylepis.2